MSVEKTDAGSELGGRVKVYIYDPEFGSHLWEWGDRPYAPSGDMLAYSERHAHMIPREQYERWKAAEAAAEQVQKEIAELLGRSA